MNIDYISSMKRVGELTLSPKDSLSLEMNWDKKMTKEMQVDNRGRVYAICVDGVIEKLGGSSCVGGIAATFKWYMKGFNKGNSDRTFCCWNYMFKAINKGKKVEVYAVWAPLVETNIPTMTSEDRKQISIDYHIIEKNFVNEYFNIENKYPYLNMQESGRKWIDTGLLERYDYA